MLQFRLLPATDDVKHLLYAMWALVSCCDASVLVRGCRVALDCHGDSTINVDVSLTSIDTGFSRSQTWVTFMKVHNIDH